MKEPTIPEATPGAPADKRRRLAVIMFTDIEGSTVLVRQLGQERAREIVGHHNELLKSCIVEQGAGSIEKFTGDGVFATFEHPSDAISCALRIQRELDAFSEKNSLPFPFRIRIGMHLGEIVFGTESAGEIVSQHINFAARVMGVADGGQILTTVGVYEAARGFEFDEPTEHLAWANHGEFNLKGIGLVELHEITDKRIRRLAPPSSAAEIKHPANLRRIESKGYEIHSRIGQGSMGVVYLAEPPKTDNGESPGVVAIKVLASTLEDDPEARERFTRESKVISALDHPGIISINQIHTEDSPPFFTMEWIEGKPITEAAEGLNWENKAELMAKICDALDHAHQHSVVHRDLKPSNILVKTGGHPVILDFGLSMAFDSSASAGMSSSGIIGTPLYLSPEQAESEDNIGPAADIYSLGAILHEVIVGEPPFVGPSVREILDAHVHEDPALPGQKNPEIPDALQRICLMALEKDPRDRYPSTVALAEDLRRFAQGEPVRSRPRLYDNLVRNRANRHKNEVGRWFKDRLITGFEHAAIIFAYRRLVRGGSESLMESRLLQAGVLLLYLAGWFMVNGTAIWLTQHWGEGLLDERWVRVAVGVAPAVLANSLWGLFFRRGSFQRAYVMMIVGIVAMPLALGIILFESADAFELSFLSEAWWYDKQATLFSSRQGITNSQLFINLSLCSLWGAWSAWRSRTFAASSLTVVFVILLAQVIIDFEGLIAFQQNSNWASFALHQVPLFAFLVGAGYLLAERLNRRDQCIPWFAGAFLIVIAASQSMALFGPDEWVFRDWKAENRTYGKYVKLKASEIEAKSAELKNQIATRTTGIAALEKNLEQAAADGGAKKTLGSLRKKVAAEKRKLKTGRAKRETLGHGLKEYRTSIRATDWFQKQIVKKGLRPAIGLAEILAGLSYLFIGLMLRRKLPVEALPAYTILIWLTPIAVLGGLAYMDVSWPKSWFQVNIFGQAIPPASLVLLAVSVSTVLLAAKLQSRIFVLVGLGFTAYTLWLLGARYLRAEDAWPISVLLTGLAVAMLVVVKEFRRPPSEEIDPLAGGPPPATSVSAPNTRNAAVPSDGTSVRQGSTGSGHLLNRLFDVKPRTKAIAATGLVMVFAAAAFVVMQKQGAMVTPKPASNAPEETEDGMQRVRALIDKKPDQPEAFIKLGHSLRRNKQFNATAHAYTEAIRLEPDNAISFVNRGEAYYQNGQNDQAIRDFTAGIRLNPDYVAAFYYRGRAYDRKDQYDRAIQDYTEAIRLNPKYTRAFKIRANLYLRKGEHEKALRDYKRLVVLEPKYAGTRNSIAWTLATTPNPGARNGAEAVRLAETAVRMDDAVEYRDTLAAAYAQAGRFGDAAAEQERAIAMLRAADRNDEIADHQSRLDLYRQGRPYWK